MDTLELPNAKVYHLQKDNTFRTKIFLEREDTTTNYLIYAPFAKPDVREDHLADTLRYSKEFFADRASLLMLDLGINERWKDVIQHYIKFFGNKQRMQAFYDLERRNPGGMPQLRSAGAGDAGYDRAAGRRGSRNSASGGNGRGNHLSELQGAP